MLAAMQLRLLSYNIKRLTGLGSENRTRSIMGAILAAEPYDAICLQEVFDEDARRVVASRLATTYPFQVPRSGGVGWRDDSGLFFASRHPITNQTFVPFDFPTPTLGFDFLVTKGVLGVSLSLPGGRCAVVFNTHLDAELATTRADQLVKVRGLIDDAARSQARPNEVAMILGGDLNVAGGGEEYEPMIATLGGPRDLGAEHRDPPALTQPADQPTKRIDYWLAFDELLVDEAPVGFAPLSVHDIDTDPFGALSLSDHRPVQLSCSVPSWA